MKPRLANQKCQAFNLIEVLVILLVLAVLALVLQSILLPIRAAQKHRADDINCVNNLHQISHAYGFWEDYHSSQHADLALTTNNGNLWVDFAAMSNVVKSPEAFHCPADTNEGGKISYFVNLDLNDRFPSRPLFGDDNFLVGDSTHPLQVYTDNASGGVPIKSGVVEILSNTPVAWMYTRHVIVGNVAFADGSVSETSNNGLQLAFQQSGLLTNRLAIP